MNFSKASLWLTNFMIGAAIFWFVGLTGYQFMGFDSAFNNEHIKGVENTKSKSAIVKYSVLHFDLEYYFVFRNGKIIIDEYLISPENVELNFNYSKATESDFMNVSSGAEYYKVPAKTEKLYLPIEKSDIFLYRYLSLFEMLLLTVIKVLLLLWIRRLILNFSKGNFFVRANHQLLYRIGGLLIIVPIILFVFQNYFTNSFMSLGVSLPEGYSLSVKGIGFQWNYLYASLLTVLMAQAFKQGIDLKIDKDLTI